MNYFAGEQFVLWLHSIPQGSGAHDTEADVLVPVVGVVVVPVRRKSVLG